MSPEGRGSARIEAERSEGRQAMILSQQNDYVETFSITTERHASETKKNITCRGYGRIWDIVRNRLRATSSPKMLRGDWIADNPQAPGSILSIVTRF